MLRNVLKAETKYTQENLNLIYSHDHKLVFYIKHDESSSFLNMTVLLDIEYVKDWE
jgi:hypothetical protein